MFKRIDNSLDPFLVEEVNLSLTILLSMSMSIVDGVQAICDDCIAVLVVENNLFANSLIGATIQDSGKRERSDVHI